MKTTVSVVCYHHKILTNGESPIMLRICKGGKRTMKSLGISVHARYWDFATNQPQRNCPNRNCGAILEAWAPGVQGGKAVADILFGVYNPSGKLAMSFPVNVGQIPIYYSTKPTGRPYVPYGKYTAGYIDCLNEPLYPFGYGLSYGKVEYSNLRVDASCPDAGICVTVTLGNTGAFTTAETVQLYIGDPVASISCPVKELKAFKKVVLSPGETKDVGFVVTEDDLKFYNERLEYVWEPGDFIFEVGPDSKNTISLKNRIE